MEEIPKVGVGVFVMKNGKFLFGKRRGAHGSGTWSLPGGKLDFKESWKECAKREVFEEANVSVKNIRFVTATNDVFDEGLHYVTLFMICDFYSGDVEIKEPEKCDEWKWVSWDELKDWDGKLFVPIKNLLKEGFELRRFLEIKK
jgi:8-oxo-dGTP diphosphatase